MSRSELYRHAYGSEPALIQVINGSGEFLVTDFTIHVPFKDTVTSSFQPSSAWRSNMPTLRFPESGSPMRICDQS